VENAHPVGLIMKYLGRPLTAEEQAALVRAIPGAFQEARQNCAAQRFDAYRELEELEQQTEADKIAEFVEVWQDSEDRLSGRAGTIYQKDWTEDELKFLKKSFDERRPRRDVARALGRSLGSVAGKMERMGLKLGLEERLRLQLGIGKRTPSGD
jgi:hypothetical protein